MSGNDRVTYQVIASGTSDKAGVVLRARVGAEPFIIGSGDKADLKLDDPRLLPVHARLIVTSKGQTLLINMGAQGTMSLNGEPMPSFTPVHWKAGIQATLGSFELELVALDIEGENGRVERLQPALITQESEVASSESSFVIDWGSKGTRDRVDETPPPKSTVLYEQSEILADFVPQSLADEDTQHGGFESITEATEVARTPAMPFSPEGRALAPLPPISATIRGIMVGDTLPKDWLQAGKLSAQTAISPINLVAGERVRVPISVRNDYSEPVKLRVYAAGLPRDAVSLPHEGVTVLPGEVTAFDIILQPKVRPPESQVDFLVRLSDPNTPEVVLTLTMQVVFKDAPNLTGWYEPKIARDNNPVYFCLQNHTRGTAMVFLSGYTDVNGLHLIPEQSQVEIPAGQIAKVPVRFDLPAKRLFFSSRHNYSMLVREPSRAPLDFPGIIHVRARVSGAMWLLLGIVALGAFLGVRAILPQPNPVQSVSATPTREVSATFVAPTEDDTILIAPGDVTSEVTEASEESSPTVVTATNTPFPIETHTPTATITDAPPTSTATPTMTPTPPFEDPRPINCAIDIPPGWKPYTVQAGDRVYRLAVDRGTTSDEVARVNCLADPRVLQVGQILLLPVRE